MGNGCFELDIQILHKSLGNEIHLFLHGVINQVKSWMSVCHFAALFIANLICHWRLDCFPEKDLVLICLTIALNSEEDSARSCLFPFSTNDREVYRCDMSL